MNKLYQWKGQYYRLEAHEEGGCSPCEFRSLMSPCPRVKTGPSARKLMCEPNSGSRVFKMIPPSLPVPPTVDVEYLNHA